MLSLHCLHRVCRLTIATIATVGREVEAVILLDDVREAIDDVGAAMEVLVARDKVDEKGIGLAELPSKDERPPTGVLPEGAQMTWQSVVDKVFGTASQKMRPSLSMTLKPDSVALPCKISLKRKSAA